MLLGHTLLSGGLQLNLSDLVVYFWRSRRNIGFLLLNLHFFSICCFKRIVCHDDVLELVGKVLHRWCHLILRLALFNVLFHLLMPLLALFNHLLQMLITFFIGGLENLGFLPLDTLLECLLIDRSFLLLLTLLGTFTAFF